MSGLALEAVDCESLAYSRTEVWRLGSVPPALVGKPGVVRAAMENVSFVGHGGGGGTVGGTVAMRIGASAPWPLGSFECRAGTCSPPPGMKPGPLVLETEVAALPAELDVQFRSEVFVKEGSGRATLQFEARVASVVLSGG